MNFFYPLRFLLYPFALLYGAIVWLRNRLYDSGFSSSVEFSIPVIAVGNLSVGGTGKTPHVEYLIRLLQYEFKVATMSRGYKRRTRGFILAEPGRVSALSIGDEPMQYHTKFPEVAVSVAEDRVMGIPELLRLSPTVDLVLLDDAFQHRSVRPGLNILITEWSRPYSSDYILPLGRLREGRSAAKRADVVIVSKCPAEITEIEAEKLKQALIRKAGAPVFFTTLRYSTAYDFFTGDEVTIAPDAAALLVCGIARPGPLQAYLERRTAGVHLLSYPDHHFFHSANLEEIRSAYNNWQSGNKIIITTEKDAARLALHRQALAEWNIPIVVLPVSVFFLFGGDAAFETRVRTFVSCTIAENAL